jgi:hypothetical protein
MPRLLILAGAALIAIGLAWPWLKKLPFGRLPGDIVIHRDGFTFAFPLATCLILSAIATLLLWLLRR